MSRTAERYGSPWLPDVFAVLFRGRHPVMHGNTDDIVRMEGSWMRLGQALAHVARVGGAELVGYLDASDGLTFVDSAEHDRFDALAIGAQECDQREAGDAPARARAAFAQLDAREGFPSDRRLGNPLEVLPSLRRVLAQAEGRMAIIVDAPDLMFQDPRTGGTAERRRLAELRRIATIARAGQHQLAFVMRRELPPPAWLLHSVPHVEPVVIPLPDREERLRRLREDASRFHGADRLDESELEESCRELAGLADGLTLDEVAALAASSHVQEVGLDQPRRLISMARFGRRDVPLTISREGAREAAVALRRRLVGQDDAVAAVTRALRAAASGIDAASDAEGSRRKPIFTLVFAGATGVGKTELAKAIAELVFGDERALVRFDMSEYQQPHEVARLIGAPPGYVGHDAGGQLTRAVAGKPSTLLLFDEFEKADPRILDLFIHVIDDGRLTDGNGQTVDFTGTGIIFTTNLGADAVYREMRGAASSYTYERLEAEVREAIESSLRPELVGRLQRGIIVFDALSAGSVDGIARKALRQIALSARRQAGLEIVLDGDALMGPIERELLRRGGEGGMARALLTGGRAVEAVVGDVVAGALQEWIVENDPHVGTTLTVTSDGEEVLVDAAR